MGKLASTLRDVAKLAGVSVGTVSKYINNPNLVKGKNRETIAASINTLHYTPNTLARRLATGKSNTILLYIAAEGTISASTWLHELPLIQTISDCLQSTGYNLQIKIGDVEDHEKTNEYICQCADSRNIDGVMFFSAWQLPNKNILSLIQKEVPFVLLDNHNPLLNAGEISCNNEKLVLNLVDYLTKMGHREIAFINVETSQQHMAQRYQGYLQGLARHGIAHKPELVLRGDFSIDSGCRCVEEMLAKGATPTAILCGNDNMAAGAVKALHAAGLSVPEDVSVVGIDNSIVAQAVEPVLTTVQMPMKEMGQLAVQELLKKIKDSSYQIEIQMLDGHIVEGRSTGPARCAE